MASRYWVGGTASWDGTAGTKWAATSGGGGGETVPTSADDVFIDGSSGSGTVTIASGNTGCRSFNSAGFTGTIAGSANITVGDGTAGASNNAWVWGAGITRTYSGQITLASTSGTTQNITSNGKTFGSRVTIDGAGSSYSLSDTLSMAAGTLFVTRGSFTSNGQTMTIGAFSSTGSATRSVTLDNSTVTCVSSGTGSWNVAATGLTFSTNSSTSVTVGGATAMTFTGAGLTYNGTWILQTPTTTGVGTISGANTFGNLTITGNAAKTAEMTISGNQTISGTLTINGNSVTNRLFLHSNTVVTARTLTCNGTVSVSNLDLMDITGAGSASWDISACTGKSGDATGNSGITFTTAAAQTWSGTSGGNWSANAWTTRVPLPQDDVTVNAAFSASQTITFDMPRAGKSIDFTGVTGSPVLSTALVTVDIFGSLTLAAGLGTVAGLAITFHGRGSFTLTAAGKTLGFIDLVAPSGTITQQDALTCGQLLSSTGRGTWNTSGYSVTCSDLVVGTSNTFTCVNSTVTVTSTSCSFSSSAGVTTTGSTLILSYTGASTVNFSPGNKTFPTLQFAPASGTLSILSSGTFGTASISSTGTRTIQVSAGSTLTFTGGASAMASGTSGNLITYQSSSGGNAFSVSSDTTLVCDYISLKDCTGAGTGKSHFAGSHSTNVSGNTNWTFTAPPTSNRRRRSLLALSA